MSNDIYEAFVYCWTDQKNRKLYVGYHKGSIDDGYICSSKPMMKEYNQRPQDFTRQIIATGNAEDMYILETAILKADNAMHNELYYNLRNNSFCFHGHKHTEETKAKLRKAWKERPNVEERMEHIKTLHVNRIVKPFTEEHKQKLREANLGKNNPMFGKKLSVETRRKMSESRRGKRPTTTCPHCGLHGAKANLTRYHFNNCKTLTKSISSE